VLNEINNEMESSRKYDGALHILKEYHSPFFIYAYICICVYLGFGEKYVCPDYGS
jgi:hypothetical protein